VANWGLPGCPNYISTCAVTMNADVSGVVALALKPTIALTLNGGGSVVLASNAASSVTCTSSCTQPMDRWTDGPGIAGAVDGGGGQRHLLHDLGR